MTVDLKTAEKFAKLMDSKFKIFGFRFGIDSLLGLIPGAGDLVGLILSTYLLILAIKLGVPRERLFQMMINILIDFGIGTIPLVGDFSDFFYKANSRNLKIIQEFVNKQTSS